MVSAPKNSMSGEAIACCARSADCRCAALRLRPRKRFDSIVFGAEGLHDLVAR